MAAGFGDLLLCKNPNFPVRAFCARRGVVSLFPSANRRRACWFHSMFAVSFHFNQGCLFDMILHLAVFFDSWPHENLNFSSRESCSNFLQIECSGKKVLLAHSFDVMFIFWCCTGFFLCELVEGVRRFMEGIYFFYTSASLFGGAFGARDSVAHLFRRGGLTKTDVCGPIRLALCSVQVFLDWVSTFELLKNFLCLPEPRPSNGCARKSKMYLCMSPTTYNTFYIIITRKIPREKIRLLFVGDVMITAGPHAYGNPGRG